LRSKRTYFTFKNTVKNIESLNCQNGYFFSMFGISLVDFEYVSVYHLLIYFELM